MRCPQSGRHRRSRPRRRPGHPRPGRLFGDLEPGGLARRSPRVVERLDQGQATGLSAIAAPSASRSWVAAVVEHHLGAQVAGAVDLGAWRVGGHDDDAATPCSAAARATPCAWFPDENAITPRARRSGGSADNGRPAAACLERPVCCRHSALTSTRPPGDRVEPPRLETQRRAPDPWPRAAAARKCVSMVNGSISSQRAERRQRLRFVEERHVAPAGDLGADHVRAAVAISWRWRATGGRIRPRNECTAAVHQRVEQRPEIGCGLRPGRQHRIAQASGRSGGRGPSPGSGRSGALTSSSQRHGVSGEGGAGQNRARASAIAVQVFWTGCRPSSSLSRQAQYFSITGPMSVKRHAGQPVPARHRKYHRDQPTARGSRIAARYRPRGGPAEPATASRLAGRYRWRGRHVPTGRAAIVEADQPDAGRWATTSKWRSRVSRRARRRRPLPSSV